MIILTLNPKIHPSAHSFAKNRVIIGSQGDHVDLPIEEEGLSHEHIKIEQIEGRYLAYNKANDPFLTLNGQPFGKKVLKKGDLFKVGKTEIIFDFKNGETQEIIPREVYHAWSGFVNLDSARQSQMEALRSERRGSAPSGQAEEEDPFGKVAASPNSQNLTARGINEIDIEEMMRQTERLETQKVGFNPFEIEEKDNHEVIFKFEEKEPEEKVVEEESYLAPAPENSESESEISPLIPPPPVKNFFKKRILFSIFALFALVCTLITSLYFFLAEQMYVQEIRASQGIADIAMALTYAQLHHHKPPNQNWADPEYIKENLRPVLPNNYSSLVEVDMQCKFINCPYILRVYPSRDMAQFLIIAQPAPSLLQWFFPKSAILVDSHYMEIRKINDIRTLNRILVDPNTFDSGNTPEISNLVHQAQIIPLKALATHKEHPEFLPPKELALMRPGAENLIYNAPRYFKFNEPIVEKVEKINKVNENNQQIAALLQDIAIFSKWHSMVIYVPEGVEEAIQVQKGLTPYAPRQKFLVGYLTFNSKSGHIEGSHMVLTSNYFKKTSSLTSPMRQEMVLPSKPIVIEEKAIIASKEEDTTSVGMDNQDPLFLKIAELASERQQKLSTVAEEMTTLLKENLTKGSRDFPVRFQALFAQYQQFDHEMQEKIEKGLSQIYHENVVEKKISPDVYVSYVDAAELESFLPATIGQQISMLQNNKSPDQVFEYLIEQIYLARDFPNLDQTVEETINFLTPEQFPDNDKLASLQNQLRIKVMQKLEQLLFFPTGPQEPDAYHEKNRWILLRILKNGKITDPDEREFYLNEYDYLTEKAS